MPIAYVDYRNIGSLPHELENHLDAEKWNRIKSDLYPIASNNTLIACAVEWGICCCTCLLCVFCAHPCIDTAIAELRINDSLVRLNRELFEGQPVLTRQGPNIVINTDFIPLPKTTVSVDSTGTAVFVQPNAQVIYVSSTQPLTATNPTTASTVVSQSTTNNYQPLTAANPVPSTVIISVPPQQPPPQTSTNDIYIPSLPRNFI